MITEALDSSGTEISCTADVSTPTSTSISTATSSRAPDTVGSEAAVDDGDTEGLPDTAESEAAAEVCTDESAVDSGDAEKLPETAESEAATAAEVCTDESAVDNGDAERLPETAESEAAAAEECTDDAGVEEDAVAQEKKPSSRVQIRNLPRYLQYKQIRELLAKQLSKFVVKNIRHMGMMAFFSLPTPEEAAAAVQILDGFQIKGRALRARIAQPEPPKISAKPSENDQTKGRTARERVTPLADKPYSEQLEIKLTDVKRITANFLKEMIAARVDGANEMNIESLIEPIRPSPRITEYRNKCEFTVGRDIEERVCVGFVGGRFTANQHYVVPVDTCDNISTHMKRVVKAFEKFVVETGQPPFNEFERKGVWKMLSVREFGSDLMMIVTVFPLEDMECEKLLIKGVKERFLQLSNLSDENSLFRVTSLYWQRLANASDPAIYEYIGGAPYVYETILDARFRVSPSSFFQTNSAGAAVLYKTIAEKCGLKKIGDAAAQKATDDEDAVAAVSEKDLEECEDESSEEPTVKKTKIEVVENVDEQQANLILDICCGTGTIGISLMKLAKTVERKFLLGVEIVPEAVEDANVNATDNGLSEGSYKFVAGKAENVFYRMERFIPSWICLKTANIVGVIDPPRAGINEKVIIGCRTLSQLKRIVFVSCNPSLAMKNMVDLCRPTSRKYEGVPFRITSITPVDMFPQTTHCEWVVQLDR